MRENQTAKSGFIFEEEQGFRQTGVVVVLAAVMVFFLGFVIISSVSQFLLDRPFGNKPLSNPGLILANLFLLAVGVGLPALILNMKMVTRLEPDQLRVDYWPLKRRTIPLASLASWKALRYRPIRDNLGWGIRYSVTRRWWVYSVSGNQGVLLEFTDGRKLLLGSRRPEELVAHLDRLRGQSPRG